MKKVTPFITAKLRWKLTSCHTFGFWKFAMSLTPQQKTGCVCVCGGVGGGGGCAFIVMKTQQTHQRWSSTFINIVSKFQRVDVHLSTLLQRSQNNVETTLIELRWFNVDKPTLFQLWYWLKMKVEPTYVYRHFLKRWSKIDGVTLIQCWWPNVVSILILVWKEKLSQRMFIGVEKTALK